MITPAYSPTATERVLPRLALDFTTGVLDPRVTVTRALNTATRVNSSGFIEIVNANLPRFDYDPVTLAPRGLLIEETRENKLTYSDQYNNPAWAQVGGTISPDTVISPDGTQNADTLTANAGSSVHSVQYAYTFTAAAHTESTYIKKGTHRYIQLRFGNSVATNAYANFDVEAGVVGTIGAGLTSATIRDAGNGYYRCSVTVTAAAVASGWGIFLVTGLTAAPAEVWNAVGTETVYLGGSQLELGAFATSYIPTTTTSLTRNLDVVTMTGTNFSDWFNPNQGTFVVGLQKISPSSQAIYGFDVVGAASTYSMRVRLGTDARMQSVDNGAVQVDSQLAGSVPTTPAKYAMAYKLNDYAGAADGAAVVTDTSGTVPALSSLNIGSTIVRNLYMRTIYYYPQRLINNEVQAFSK